MSPGTYFLFGSLLGIVLGLLLGWLLTRRNTSSDDRLETELRQQLSLRELELAQLRTQLAETARGKSVAEANKDSAEKLLIEQKAIHERALREAKETQETALGDLRSSFKALSLDSLRELQPQFLERVMETVGRLQET